MGMRCGERKGRLCRWPRVLRPVAEALAVGLEHRRVRRALPALRLRDHLTAIERKSCKLTVCLVQRSFELRAHNLGHRITITQRTHPRPPGASRAVVAQQRLRPVTRPSMWQVGHTKGTHLP